MSTKTSLFFSAQNALAAARKAADATKAFIADKSLKDGRLSVSLMDKYQLVTFDWALTVAELTAAGVMLDYAAKFPGNGDSLSLEERLALVFTAESVQQAANTVKGREAQFGLTPEVLAETFESTAFKAFCAEGLQACWYEEIADAIRELGHGGRLGLNDDLEMMRQAFRDFGEAEVKPLAEKVHRNDLLIPEKIIKGLAELGCFGLSIPEEYGGFHGEDQGGNQGMVLVTEELSRASLGIAGSLITRPEILSKALLKGGTQEQKERFLPPIAAGERMVSVAVTEPDYGSDVAGLRVSATPSGTGWLLNGCKTWCTFAGRADTMLVLARTNPDLSLGHKGLSILIAEKPAFEGHEFAHPQPEGGKISGRAINTIGYRGMHSYEVVFENYFVPGENLIGGEKGLGKGFYLQMEGFAGGRLQTAARANGVMQAAFERALTYALERQVFGQPIFDYQLTKYKIARMAMITQAARQFAYYVAGLFDKGEGSVEASMVKFYASRISEWVTREAVQIHGGMGYAEEYDVSRYFVDSKVFSVFEGAEEILALRVVARSLVEECLKGK